MTAKEKLHQLAAELEATKKALEEEKARKPKGAIKVSAKGAVSVYGLGRFPVTLYASQWEGLLARAEEIRDFIAENEDSLSRK